MHTAIGKTSTKFVHGCVSRTQPKFLNSQYFSIFFKKILFEPSSSIYISSYIVKILHTLKIVQAVLIVNNIKPLKLLKLLMFFKLFKYFKLFKLFKMFKLINCSNCSNCYPSPLILIPLSLLHYSYLFPYHFIFIALSLPSAQSSQSAQCSNCSKC